MKTAIQLLLEEYNDEETTFDSFYYYFRHNRDKLIELEKNRLLMLLLMDFAMLPSQ